MDNKMDNVNQHQPEPLDDFERSLQRALRHSDVRAETTAKFLAIAAEAHAEQKRTGSHWFRPRTGGLLFVMPRFAFAGAMAAALAVGSFISYDLHQRHERQHNEQQFAEAMRITDRALQHTQDQTREQLDRLGITLSN